MAGTDEPITSPDQRKPDHPGVIRVLVILASLAFLTLTFGNHTGNVENIWLIALAAGGLLWVVMDWVLRRNGLR